MREFVAVNDSFVLLRMAALKREALMFNRIASPDFRACDAYLSIEQQPKILAEIDWLMEQGILFEPEGKFNDEGLCTSEEFINIRNDIDNDSEVLKIMLTETEEEKAKRFITELDGEKFEIPCVETLVRWRDVGLIMDGYKARYLSAQLKVLDNMDAHPILFTPMPSSV